MKSLREFILDRMKVSLSVNNEDFPGIFNSEFKTIPFKDFSEVCDQLHIIYMNKICVDRKEKSFFLFEETRGLKKIEDLKSYIFKTALRVAVSELRKELSTKEINKVNK